MRSEKITNRSGSVGECPVNPCHKGIVKEKGGGQSGGLQVVMSAYAGWVLMSAHAGWVVMSAHAGWVVMSAHACWVLM